jgi:ribosomal protein L30E
VGSTPTRHALDSGKARLLVVASDARASIRTPWVEAAIKAGKVMAWGSKADLGSLTSRAEVGIVAILDDRLAAEVARSLVIRSMPQPDSDANHRQEGG